MKSKVYLTKDTVLNLTIEQYHDMCQNLLSISKSNLEDDLTHHSILYAHYHGLLVYVKRILDKMTVAFEQYCAKTKNDELTRNKSSGSKATATYLEDYLKTQEEYITSRNNLIDVEEIYGWLKALCFSLEHKKDMLVQMSANLRSETKLYS